MLRENYKSRGALQPGFCIMKFHQKKKTVFFSVRQFLTENSMAAFFPTGIPSS
jgi:hypothetical protein